MVKLSKKKNKKNKFERIPVSDGQNDTESKPKKVKKQKKKQPVKESASDKLNEEKTVEKSNTKKKSRKQKKKLTEKNVDQNGTQNEQPQKPKKQKKKQTEKNVDQNGTQNEQPQKPKKRKLKSTDTKEKKARYDNTVYQGHKDGTKKVDVSAWVEIFAPPPVLQALSELGFSTPTEIQRLALPVAIKGRKDIIGAAETGSGKTLAFGIPIIHGILGDREREAEAAKMNNDDSGVENSELDGEDLDNENFEREISKAKKDVGVRDDNDDSEDDDEVKNIRTDIDFSNVEDLSYSAVGFSDEENFDSEESDEENFGGEESDLENIGGEESDDENFGGEESDEENFGGEESDEENFGGEESDEENFGGEKSDESDLEEISEGSKEDRLKKKLKGQLGCVKVIDKVKFDFLDEKKKKKGTKPLRALIVTPTRELAIQIKSHLTSVLVHTDIKVAVLIGGLASAKQERLLKRSPEIVVGTPGRLWELISEGNEHLNQIENIKYLAIDETDRMVEKGHFEELQKILEKINENEEAKAKRQNFVFSATLTLVHFAPKRLDMKKKFQDKITPEMKIQKLSHLIGLKAKPKIIDVTRQFGTAESLTESRINCHKDDKESYLYYFLKQYPGRTLIFCNSIDCVRRLQNLFTLLQCDPLALHANMHQKQRLKNLERFSSSSQAMLLATDVAARGLDIPNIQHVVHFETPRTAETYIHRSGRTARATQEGLSVLFISSAEVRKYRLLCKTMNRSNDLPVFPVDSTIFKQVKKRIDFAHELETLEHAQRNLKAKENWFIKAAREAEIELDSDSSSDEEESMIRNMENARQKQENKMMRLKLNKMLSVPLFSFNFSGKYPTQSGSLISPVGGGYVGQGQSKTDACALSVMKKESVEYSKLVKKVKPKRNLQEKRTNKKKFKGYEKRRLKLQKEIKKRDKMNAEMAEEP